MKILCKDLTDRKLLEWAQASLLGRSLLCRAMVDEIDAIVKDPKGAEGAFLRGRKGVYLEAMALLDDIRLNLDLGMRIIDGNVPAVDRDDRRVWDVI